MINEKGRRKAHTYCVFLFQIEADFLLLFWSSERNFGDIKPNSFGERVNVGVLNLKQHCSTRLFNVFFLYIEHL